MEYNEYQQKQKALEREFQIKKSELSTAYALANNSYKIGDIFTDHIGSIRIEAIRTTIHNYKPTCIYFGLELKKDGTPKKKGEKRDAYQINEEK